MLTTDGDQRVRRLTTREPWLSHGPGLATRERDVHQMLEPTLVPAPRSRALDAHGERCGFPGHLMTLVPGRVEHDRVDRFSLDGWRTCSRPSTTSHRRSRSAPTSRGPGSRSTPSRRGQRMEDCGATRSRCSAPLCRTTTPASSTATSNPATCSGRTTGSAGSSTGSRRRWARHGSMSRTAAPTSPSRTATRPPSGSPPPMSPVRGGNRSPRCHGHRRVPPAAGQGRVRPGERRAPTTRGAPRIGHAAHG